jgi:hypothetical protein
VRDAVIRGFSRGARSTPRRSGRRCSSATGSSSRSRNRRDTRAPERRCNRRRAGVQERKTKRSSSKSFYRLCLSARFEHRWFKRSFSNSCGDRDREAWIPLGRVLVRPPHELRRYVETQGAEMAGNRCLAAISRRIAAHQSSQSERRARHKRRSGGFSSARARVAGFAGQQRTRH